MPWLNVLECFLFICLFFCIRCTLQCWDAPFVHIGNGCWPLNPTANTSGHEKFCSESDVCSPSLNIDNELNSPTVNHMHKKLCVGCGFNFCSVWSLHHLLMSAWLLSCFTGFFKPPKDVFLSLMAFFHYTVLPRLE